LTAPPHNCWMALKPKTAVVFSAGGMYGAWEVGVWKALAPRFAADMVVGASIGAVNGYAVAGGCPPEELERQWLALEALARVELQLPWGLRGVLNSRPMELLIQELHRMWTPRVEFGVVVTDTLRLRPVLVRTPDVTWQHLAASVAMIGIYRQYRICGRVYSDGGLLHPLPIWAAMEMGATRIVAINCLTKMPSALVRGVVKTFRRMARWRAPGIPDHVEVIYVEPSEELGPATSALIWSRANVERWLSLGEKDGAGLGERLRGWATP
jgi:NTE family protein